MSVQLEHLQSYVSSNNCLTHNILIIFLLSFAESHPMYVWLSVFSNSLGDLHDFWNSCCVWSLPLRYSALQIPASSFSLIFNLCPFNSMRLPYSAWDCPPCKAGYKVICKQKTKGILGLTSFVFPFLGLMALYYESSSFIHFFFSSYRHLNYFLNLKNI